MAGLLVGCSATRNSAPIAYGVPDGFVIARVATLEVGGKVREERVTYAFRDQRRTATLDWPQEVTGAVPWVEGDPQNAEANRERAAKEGILVVTGGDPGLQEMVGTLEDVRPR